ncbi:hypothetical protein SAMN05216297_10989 [Flavobacterium phragmitis]|uniref:Uncharacterized protein n=1 Tax=Flavobacterium phragmitis TaxID=739143 RepID=A0A1I1TFF0_9FLAO|nr:hypothetical protein SAMN05216297_10989 [Flavobacterium phragmitis]
MLATNYIPLVETGYVEIYDDKIMMLFFIKPKNASKSGGVFI